MKRSTSSYGARASTTPSLHPPELHAPYPIRLSPDLVPTNPRVYFSCWKGEPPTSGNISRESRCPRFLVSVALLLPLLAGIAAGQDSLRLPSETIPSGETLIYEIRWDPPAWMFFLPSMTAGELTVQFQHQAQLEGKPVHRIAARATSSGFFPKLTGVAVDDSFESMVNVSHFCSVRMTKKLREGKRHRDVVLTFDGQHGTGRYVAYDAAQTPPAQLKNEEVKNLPTCVQDILSGIYVTRLHNLRSGEKFPLVVSDDGTVKQVEVRVKEKEKVDAIAGRFVAWKVETVSVFGGLFKGGGTFLVWFSDDAYQVPVKFEAKVKVGRVFGTVKQIKR